MPYGEIIAESEHKGALQLYKVQWPDELMKRPTGISPDAQLLCGLWGNASGSDINWNNFHGRFFVGWGIDQDRIYNYYFSAKIMPFTKNCGAKALSHVTVWKEHYGSVLLKMCEYAMYDRCNAGMIVGSDHVGNSTYNYIKKYGQNYLFSEKICNPTYGKPKNQHMITLFYKLQEAPEAPLGMTRDGNNDR